MKTYFFVSNNLRLKLYVFLIITLSFKTRYLYDFERYIILSSWRRKFIHYKNTLKHTISINDLITNFYKKSIYTIAKDAHTFTKIIKK